MKSITKNKYLIDHLLELLKVVNCSYELKR